MSMRSLALLAWTVWLEFLRRKEFYVVVILTFLFVIGVVVVRLVGVESPETAAFLMSFGLSLSYLLAAILAVLIAARQLPEEIENGTLLPLLARPVARAEIILGKTLAVAAVAALTLALLATLAWLPVPRSPDQRWIVLAQALALQMLALASLAMLTTWLALMMPGPVAALVALTTLLAGGPAIDFLDERLRTVGALPGALAAWGLAALPDFSVFDHAQRYVAGGEPLSVVTSLAIVLYAAAWFAVFYALAAWTFHRRSL